MGTAPVFASAGEALEMARAALGYLADADPGGLTAEEQAGCLRDLERCRKTCRLRSGFSSRFSGTS